MSLKFTASTHRYLLDGKKVQGVTTILSQGIPKPALPPWAARTVAEWVADNEASLEVLRQMGREPMVQALKNVPWQKRVTHEVVTIKQVVLVTEKQRIQLFIRELLTPKSAHCLQGFIQVESHFNPQAKNPTSSAKGVGQLLASTYKNIGLKHSNDGLSQVIAMISYVGRRYNGNFCQALKHERTRNWY